MWIVISPSHEASDRMTGPTHFSPSLSKQDFHLLGQEVEYMERVYVLRVYRANAPALSWNFTLANGKQFVPLFLY